MSSICQGACLCHHERLLHVLCNKSISLFTASAAQMTHLCTCPASPKLTPTLTLACVVRVVQAVHVSHAPCSLSPNGVIRGAA